MARWTNTNKLLDSGFSGVKTGVTAAAGPCLCVALERDDNCLIVTTLSSRTRDQRWVEVPRLANWAYARFMQ